MGISLFDQQLHQIINSYPLIVPRIYNYLRLLILPLLEIARYVPNQGTILDVGCGYGLLDIYLAKTSVNRKIVGSELSSKRVKIAAATAQAIDNVSFVNQDLLNQHHSLSVDCVLLIDLLHHVSYTEQRHLLKTIAAFLPQGGKLIIKDLDTEPPFKFYWNLVHDKLITGFDKLYFMSSQELARILEQNGFSVFHNRINHPLYSHHIFVCEKQ